LADVSRGNRPLSPHLQIYRPQITSVLSILHRITGAGLMVTAMLVSWWFMAAATGAEYFGFVDWILTSVIGKLIMIASLWALWYHFLNGIRHLVWDAGYGFALEIVSKSGVAVVVGSVALTILTLLVAT
jgi:succinate dehydrogenase / fumarate reductase cytochrome b subunit